MDTNFLISNLVLIESIQAWHSKYKHVIVIPWAVIQERTPSLDNIDVVDGLKTKPDKVHGKSIGVLAREAIRWAQDSLAGQGNGSVRGQKRGETVDEGAIRDDSILACCMYFSPLPLTS